jgi:fructose-bisphosphate aldolase, class II
MTWVPLDKVLRTAVAQTRGVGAFNVSQIEHAEAFVAAAERACWPQPARA